MATVAYVEAQELQVRAVTSRWAALQTAFGYRANGVVYALNASWCDAKPVCWSIRKILWVASVLGQYRAHDPGVVSLQAPDGCFSGHAASVSGGTGTIYLFSAFGTAIEEQLRVWKR